MYLFDNPVLQHELVVNLRRGRSFLLLAAYVGLLGAVVYLRWPSDVRVDLTNPLQSRQLVDMFFLGQFVLASLMVPSVAAGAISGEKERKTYEMLLATPLRPGAIILGKMLASLAHIALLIVASLPIVMLVLPQGGVSLYEVLAAYLGLLLAIVTFGLVSLACSSEFSRTLAAMAVSILAILPLVVAGSVTWWALGGGGAELRFWGMLFAVPPVCLLVCGVLYRRVARRLLQPPDVGSEGKDVIDQIREQDEAVGLVIYRDQFPDMLFAPAKRTDLLPEGANPVFDKEMRSEIFSQGTLMMRVVIQVSMGLAIPLMGALLFLASAPSWYFAYILLFNTLVAPIFASGSVTSERERATLDLLLVTVLSPWQILWGKLVSAWRVSTVLTLLITFPVVLACLMVWEYASQMLGFVALLGIVLLTCLTTTTCGLLCSVVCRRSSQALVLTYLLLGLLYFMPISGYVLTRTSLTSDHRAATVARAALVASPFAAAFSVDLAADTSAAAGSGSATGPGLSRIADANWRLPLGNPSELRFVLPAHVAFTVLLNGLVLLVITALFRQRWLVSQ